MSSDAPNIPITPEFDLSKYYEQIAQMEQRAVQFAQKLNRTISAALTADPKSANSFFKTITEIDSFLNGLESRAAKVSEGIQRAFSDAAQSAASSVGQTFENTLNQLTERALADLRSAKGKIASQSGGGGSSSGGRGGSPPSGLGPSSPRFPAREALADVNRALDDFASQSPFQRVLSGLSQLERSLRSDLPAAADITESAITELNSILRSGATELERNQEALLALERTQRAIQSVQTGARVRAHLVGGERDNAIRDEGRGSTRASDLDDQYKRLTRTVTLLGDAQNVVGRSASSLRGEIRATTAEVKKQIEADEELAKAQREANKARFDREQSEARFNANLRRDRDAHNDLVERLRRQDEAQRRTAESSRVFSRAQLGSHESLLALLGVSRFLPGQLGQVVSGLALIEGGMQSITGLAIGVVGAVAAIGVQLFQVGARFNQALNQTRVQAEGLGLTVDEVRAFQLVLSQSNGSIENFAVGIKKINQAITGIGPEARETRALLEGIFAGSGFRLDGNTKTIDVIKQIAKQIDTMERSGLGAAVAGEIFGRSWDEVKGRLKDLNEQLEESERLVKKTGITSVEAQRTAKAYAREIAELELRWDSLVNKLQIPAVANVAVKFTTDVTAGLDEVLTKIPTIQAGLLAIKGAKGLGASDENVGRGLKGVGGLGLLGVLSLIGEVSSSDERVASESAKKSDALQTSLEEALKKFDENSNLEGAAIERLKKRLQDRRGSLSVEQIRQEEIAIKQRESDLLTKQVAQIQKSASDTDLINEADKKLLADANSTVQEKAEAQNRLNVNLNRVLILEAQAVKVRQEQNRIRKELSDLTSEGRTRAQVEAEQRLTEDLERLFESRQGLIPRGDKYLAVQRQIEGRLQARIAELTAARDDKSDPGAQQELNRRLAELRRRRRDAQKEITRQAFQDAEQAINERRQLFSQAIALLESQQEEFRSRVTREFESGGIDFSTFVAQEAAFILQRVELLRDANRRIIADIDSQIGEIRQKLNTGQIDPLDAASKFTQLQRERGNQIQQGLEAEKRAKSDSLKLENESVKQLLDARRRLTDLDIKLTERTNARRLELQRRAAEFSLTIEDAAIRERGRLLAAQNDREIAGLLTLLRDKRTLQAQISGLQGEQAGVTFSLPGVIEKGDVAALRRVIDELSAKGNNQSSELIGILEKAVELLEKRRDLEQEIALNLLDVQIKKEQESLNLRRQSLSAAERIFDFEREKLSFLEENELLTRSQIDERRVEIERRRLDLLTEQARVVKDAAVTEARRRAEAVATSGKALTDEVLLDIVNSADIAQLNSEFAQLTGESLLAANNLEVLNSTLGTFYTGIQDVVETLEGAPEPFDKLATVLEGVRKISAAFLAPRAERRDPAQELQAASRAFNSEVASAARAFYSQVVNSSTGITQTLAAQKIDVSAGLNRASTVLTTTVTKAASDIDSAVLVFRTTSSKIAGAIDDDILSKLKALPDGVKPVFDRLATETGSLADAVKSATERINNPPAQPQPQSQPQNAPRITESLPDGSFLFLGQRFTKEQLKRDGDRLEEFFTPWWVKPNRGGGKGRGGIDPDTIGPNIPARTDVVLENPVIKVTIDPRSVISLADIEAGRGAGLSTNQIVRDNPAPRPVSAPGAAALPGSTVDVLELLSQLPSSLPELPKAANSMLDEIIKMILAVKSQVQARKSEIAIGLVNAANQFIGGLASGSAGGRVAGFGGAAGTLTSTFAKDLKIFGAAAGPLIGGIAQVAGGIMDFIGGIWKARAEKIANEMSQNFKLIQNNFNDDVITLGEAITQTQQNIEAARRQLGSGKIGKKGGKVQLSQLEQQAADQIRQFRQRQKQIQDKFFDDLEQLQRPEEVRGLYTSITESFDRVKEFLNSFDTGAEALTHMAEAQEFLNRTFEELRDDASRELDDLIKREQEANRQFLQQRDSIIKEGRVQTGFEAAQDKLARLFELERKRVEEHAKAESDQQKLREQLSVIDQAFSRSDKVLDRLERAFSSLNNTLDRFTGGGGFFPGAIGRAREQVNNIVINQSFSGSDRNQIRRAGDEIEERLVRLGLANRVSGLYSPFRPATP